MPDSFCFCPGLLYLCDFPPDVLLARMPIFLLLICFIMIDPWRVSPGTELPGSLSEPWPFLPSRPGL